MTMPVRLGDKPPKDLTLHPYICPVFGHSRVGRSPDLDCRAPHWLIHWGGSPS